MLSQSKKMKYSIIKVSLLFCFSSLFMVFGEDSVLAVEEGVSESDHGVTVTLHSNDPNILTKLLIPSEYIEVMSLRSLGTNNEFLVLEMKFPEMTPLAPGERTKDFSIFRSPQQNSLIESGQYLRIELHEGRLDGIKELIDFNIKSHWLPEPSDPEYPGFIVFSDKIMKKEENNGYPILTRYYLPKSEIFKNKLYFECPINNRSDKNKLMCQGETSFGNFLYGNYSFSKSHIHEWQKIDTAVRAFVDSAIIHMDHSIKQ